MEILNSSLHRIKFHLEQDSPNCALCHLHFGRIVNRGAYCRICELRVCKSCREYSDLSLNNWICALCYRKANQTNNISAVTLWTGNNNLNLQSQNSDEIRNNDSSLTYSPIILGTKNKLFRSITFRDTSLPAWTIGLRGSPELRAYSSMPRHQCQKFSKVPSQKASEQNVNRNLEEAFDMCKASDESETTIRLVDSFGTLVEMYPLIPSPSKLPIVETKFEESTSLSRTKSKNLKYVRKWPGSVRARAGPRSQDYRLVFASSSSEGEVGESCGSQDEDCDWDYFEAEPSLSLTPGVPNLGRQVEEGERTAAVERNNHTGSNGRSNIPESTGTPALPLLMPVPIFVPVPVPILLPLPLTPEFTIRVEHSLSPIWRNILAPFLSNSTLSNSTRNDNLPEEITTAEFNPSEATEFNGVKASPELKFSEETVSAERNIAGKNPERIVASTEFISSRENSTTEFHTPSVVLAETSPTEFQKQDSVSCSITSDAMNDLTVKSAYCFNEMTSNSSELNSRVDLPTVKSVAYSFNELSLNSSELPSQTLGVNSPNSSESIPSQTLGVNSPNSSESIPSQTFSVTSPNSSESIPSQTYSGNSPNSSESIPSQNFNGISLNSSDSSPSQTFSGLPSNFCEIPSQALSGVSANSAQSITRVDSQTRNYKCPKGSSNSLNDDTASSGPSSYESSEEESGEGKHFKKVLVINEDDDSEENPINNTTTSEDKLNSDDFERFRKMASENNFKLQPVKVDEYVESSKNGDVNNDDSDDSSSGRYTSLITISGDGSTVCVSSEAPVEDKIWPVASGDDEVKVITGGETLSAVICLEEGLADDDSWVEELDRNDREVDGLTGSEYEYEEEEVHSGNEEDTPYCKRELDFTLHTILEESCEESDGEDDNQRANRPPTLLEKYFVFDIGGDAGDVDSVSETSSVFSERLDSIESVENEGAQGESNLFTSRLERYFLHSFMGFEKQASVGNLNSIVDNEGPAAGEEEGGPSFSDDLTVQQVDMEFDSEHSGSFSDDADVMSLDVDGDREFPTVKRNENKRKNVSELSETTNNLSQYTEGVSDSHETQLEILDETLVESSSNKINIDQRVVGEKGAASNLARKDSFNNWSSDEETNLMMSKMRSFFQSMKATQKNGNNSTRPVPSKPPQLTFFEEELTRLMRTVPGINDEQVKEIVEYLSSEDTWSDSYDSSDYTSSDLECAARNNTYAAAQTVPDVKNDSALIYERLIASFQRMETANAESPPLISKVMQHIGVKLVALMHQVSDGGENECSGAPSTTTNKPHRRLQLKPSNMSTTTEDDDSTDEANVFLPRSKSHDPLLVEEGRQEASDNERFSWRGSFESALMPCFDSRSRLSSTGENSASALALAVAKRRSAGDLITKSREQLDRVRSCGSIGNDEKGTVWSLRSHPRKRRSSVPDSVAATASNSGESADGDDDDDSSEGDHHDASSVNYGDRRWTTLPRYLSQPIAASSAQINVSTSQLSHHTNSLPRLQPQPQVSASPGIYKKATQGNVKSARYRPPGYASSTLYLPPRHRMDYSARRRSTSSLVSRSQQVLNSSYVGTRNVSPPLLLMQSDISVATSSPNLVISDTSTNLQETSKFASKRNMPFSMEEDNYKVSSPVNVSRSDSMASVYSGAGDGRYGVVTVKGEVEFGLQYNYKSGDLEIHVKQCKDLAPADVKRSRSDPYVKVYLLPDKSKNGKRKTRVKKHTLCPVFDEILKYHLTLEELETRILWLSVWHSDMFGRNDFLGEVTLNLENKVFDDPFPKVYTLQERSESMDEVAAVLRGELIIALKFVPSVSPKKPNSASLHILVKEAKHLVSIKSNGVSDPFCKSYLLPNKGGRNFKQKTPVVKRTCNPVWNHTIVYNNLSLEEMSERCLELTVWDHDRLSSNEFLGGVRISLGTASHDGKTCEWKDSNEKESALWKSMLERPNFWVESCLTLRPSMANSLPGTW